MASEDKQLEVILDFKDTAAKAHTTSEEAIAALKERNLKAVWKWISWLPLLSLAMAERTLKKSIAWLPLLSLAFMGYIANTALYESKGERGTVFFVVGSFTLLGLLYLCMKEFEKTKVSAVCMVSAALTMLLRRGVPEEFVLFWYVGSVAVLLNFIRWASGIGEDQGPALLEGHPPQGSRLGLLHFAHGAVLLRRLIVDSPILDIFVWTVAILTSALGGYLLFFHE